MIGKQSQITSLDCTKSQQRDVAQESTNHADRILIGGVDLKWLDEASQVERDRSIQESLDRANSSEYDDIPF